RPTLDVSKVRKKARKSQLGSCRAAHLLARVTPGTHQGGHLLLAKLANRENVSLATNQERCAPNNWAGHRGCCPKPEVSISKMGDPGDCRSLWTTGAAGLAGDRHQHCSRHCVFRGAAAVWLDGAVRRTVFGRKRRASPAGDMASDP